VFCHIDFAVAAADADADADNDCVYADNTTIIVVSSVVGAIAFIMVIVLFHFIR